MALEQQLTIAVSEAVTGLPAAPLSGDPIGTTILTNAAAIDQRARCSYVTLTMHPGLTASDYSNHIAAVRARAAVLGLPSPKFLAYINVSEVQTRTATGVWGPFFAIMEAANWWARNPWPNGSITEIEWPAVNLASPRKVGGFTCGEAFVRQYHASVGALISQCNGVMLDNMNYRWPTGFDYTESNTTVPFNTRDSVAMRNAIATGYDSVYTMFKTIYGANFEIHCNPRIAADKIMGFDDSARFRARSFSGFMNQNAGPGLWNNAYGIFMMDGALPASPWNAMKTYPQAAAVTSLPVQGDIYQNTFGGFKRSASLPQVNPTYLDLINELQTGNYVANVQKIRMEMYGYFDPDEFTAGSNTTIAQKQAHNRLCFGVTWALSDISPYMFPKDVPAAFPGFARAALLVITDQHKYNWGSWIDPPGLTAGPYVTVGGHPGYVRRAQNAAVLVNPRFENTFTASQPASMSFPTPTPPAGKAWRLWGTNTAPGAAILVPTNDAVYLQTVAA